MIQRPFASSILLLVAAFLPLVACRTASPAAAPSHPAVAAPRPEGAAATVLESRAMLLLMADRRLYDATALELMFSGPVEVRRELARTLGQIGDPRGRSLLQGLLVDTDAEVRRAAAFALGELGAGEARRALIVAAVDDDGEVGALAVEALGKIGAPLAEVRRALGALEAGEGWARLAPVLFRFREPEMVTAALAGLAREEAEIRAGCAYALGREARAEGVDALRSLLADRDPFVRAWAARGLGEIGGIDDLARLAPLLGDPAVSPRIQALRAGGRLLSRVAALPPLDWGDRLVEAIDDPHPGIAAAALEVAGRFLPHPELEARLRDRLEGGEPRQRELALLALAAGRVADAVARVEAAADADDPRLRARAAEAAAGLAAVEVLTRLMEDAEPRVRVAALEGLAGGAGELLPDLLRAALADADPTVRATALDLAAGQPVLPAVELARALPTPTGWCAARRRTASPVSASRGRRSVRVRAGGVSTTTGRCSPRPARRGGSRWRPGAASSSSSWPVRRRP